MEKRKKEIEETQLTSGSTSYELMTECSRSTGKPKKLSNQNNIDLAVVLAVHKKLAGL